MINETIILTFIYLSDEFKNLIEHDARISTLKTQEFDPKGQYKKIFDVVNSVGEGDVKIYRVDHDRTRAEYYIVRFEKKSEKIVGLRVKAVET